MRPQTPMRLKVDRLNTQEPVMEPDHERRIEQLEIDLSHANRMIEELNGVVIEQGRQVDRLTRLLGAMTDQVEELMENLPGHRIDRPPHY